MYVKVTFKNHEEKLSALIFEENFIIFLYRMRYLVSYNIQRRQFEMYNGVMFTRRLFITFTFLDLFSFACGTVSLFVQIHSAVDGLNWDDWGSPLLYYALLCRSSVVRFVISVSANLLWQIRIVRLSRVQLRAHASPHPRSPRSTLIKRTDYSSGCFRPDGQHGY